MKSKRVPILAMLFALAIIGLSAFTMNLTSVRGHIEGQDRDAGAATAGPGGERFEVTVTNLTRNQQFAPILAASHREGIKLFDLGEPVSPPMAILAEEGVNTPMVALLSGMKEVKDVVSAPLSNDNVVNPGKSFTLTVRAPYPFNRISVASMLVPTNDGFFGITGVEVPHGNEELTLYSPAYDAGSERNDELCTSIPGAFPECSGPSLPANGDNPVGGEEGFVHIHAGIHGVGQFSPAQRDWRNPVAKITIRRIR